MSFHHVLTNQIVQTTHSLAGIAWWDKVHNDCFIGYLCEGTKTQTRFRCDEEGNYVPRGEFCDEKKALQVKHAKQVRFSFGVALVNKEEGEVGVRINPFGYTNKNIITIREFKKLVDAQICRVKDLDRTQKAWVDSKRVEDGRWAVHGRPTNNDFWCQAKQSKPIQGS